MRFKLEYLLIFTTILLMCLPFVIQFYTPNVKFEPLNGTIEYADSVKLTWNAWKNKSWQENQEEILKKNMKIRPEIVRYQHELDYQLFREFHMGDLLKGKDDYLFSWGWSDARCCINNLDSDSLNSFVQKLKVLSDLFKQKGKYLRVIIAPSKEEIFADKLPDKYSYNNPTNDYNNYKKALDENKIEYWDLLSFYQSIMDTATYPVYSKTSVHWTKYGAHFTILKLLDDVNTYFNNLLPTIYVSSSVVSKFDNGDGDTETTLNLMSRIDTSDFLYFTYDVHQKENAFKPKMLTIGDSFYWGIKGCHRLQDIYSMESKYLFYYSTTYYPTWDPPKPVKELDIVEEIKTADGLILLNSSHNLLNFPFGFQYDIDKVIDGLRTLPNKSTEGRIEESI